MARRGSVPGRVRSEHPGILVRAPTSFRMSQGSGLSAACVGGRTGWAPVSLMARAVARVPGEVRQLPDSPLGAV